MAVIDISRSISPATAVWPGDQPVEWTWTATVAEEGSVVNLGALQMSAHTATHVDAPYHVAEGGDKTDQLPLSVFVGPAEVVDVGSAATIRPDHVADVSAARVLFKTEASRLPDEEWPDAVTSFAPATIQRLSKKDVVLVGTDAPSVDPLDSTSLPAHHAFIEAGIVNLEGLSFENVAPGSYHLLALPLKIEGADAAPVRAVLRTADGE